MMVVYLSVTSADNKRSSLFDGKVGHSLSQNWASIPRLCFYLFSILLGVAVAQQIMREFRINYTYIFDVEPAKIITYY